MPTIPDHSSGWVDTSTSRRSARLRAALLHPRTRLRQVTRKQRGMSLTHDVPAGVEEILERLGELPLSVWTYGFDHDSVRHIGPMAQDFAKAFGLGDSDKKIDMVDANGVVMAACKALLRRVEVLEARLAQIESGADDRGGTSAAG